MKLLEFTQANEVSCHLCLICFDKQVKQSICLIQAKERRPQNKSAYMNHCKLYPDTKFVFFPLYGRMKYMNCCIDNAEHTLEKEFPTHRPVICLFYNLNLYWASSVHHRLWKTLGSTIWNFTVRYSKLIYSIIISELLAENL